METQFSPAPPWQRGEDEGTLPVQVIALVQPATAAGQAALREPLGAVLAAPVARRVLAAGRLASSGLRVALAPRLDISGAQAPPFSALRL